MKMKKHIATVLFVALAVCFTSCKQKEVTSKELVDAYLETSADVDYSGNVAVNVEMLYHGEWEGIKDVVCTEYQERFDADSGVSYQKGTSTMTYVYPNGEEEPTVAEVERYIVELEDGSK